MNITLKDEACDTQETEVHALRQRVAALEQQLVARAEHQSHTEDIYNILVHQSPQALVILQDRRIVFANAMTATITGYTLEELYAMSGDDVEALVHPEDQARLSQFLHNRLHGKPAPTQHVFRMLRKDKEVRWLEELVTLTRYQGHTAFLKAYVDVTTQKRAQEKLRWSVAQQEEYYQAMLQVDAVRQELETKNNALQASQAFLHGIIEHSPASIYVKDRQGRAILVNQHCANLMGMAREHILGKTDDELFPPAFVASWRSKDTQILDTGQPIIFDETFQGDDGIHSFLSIKFPLYDEQGHINAVGTISTDMTVRKRMEEALRESEARYRSIFENATIGIFQSTPEGQILTINKAYAHMLGYDSIQDAMDSITDVAQQIYVNPSQREHVIRSVFESESTARFENRYRRKDGQELVGNLNIWIVRNDDGSVRYLEGFIEDITERKQAEEALRQSEARYRSIFENATIGIFQSTADGRVLAANPALAHMLGYATPHELIADITDAAEQLYVIPSQRRAIVQQIMAGKEQAIRAEIRYRCKGGHEITGTLNMWAIRDEQGHYRYLEGFVEDITERKQAEAARETAYARMEEINRHLHQSRDTLHTIMNGIDDGLVLLDNNGHILIANEPLARRFDTTPDALHGQSWEQLCNQTWPTFRGDLALQTLNDGRPRRRRERFVAAGGQVHILDIQTLPLFSPEHTLEQVILHMVDITETLQLETLMIENERFEASGKLAATVAHEINSPLQTIRNFLYLANDENDPQRGTYLQLVRDEIDRVGTIVRQLLHLFQPETSKPSPVDVNALIERVLLLMSGTLTKNAINTQTHLQPGLPLMHGRADQLTQVLLNLINNAIDAMDSGGSLTLQTRAVCDHPPATNITITITDTGEGMCADIQSQIFESFFTTRPHGTGLGLAISQKIVTQHRGHILVESTPGAGSSFTVVLPVIPD